MLVLQRVKNESVMIGDDITVTVTDVCLYTGRVKLGFSAPSDVTIDREEIYLRRKSGWTIPKHLDEDDLKCLQKHNTISLHSNVTQ